MYNRGVYTKLVCLKNWKNFFFTMIIQRIIRVPIVNPMFKHFASFLYCTCKTLLSHGTQAASWLEFVVIIIMIMSVVSYKRWLLDHPRELGSFSFLDFIYFSLFSKSKKKKKKAKYHPGCAIFTCHS